MQGRHRVTFGLGLLASDTPDQFVRLVRLAEERGFSTIWVPDQKFFRECYAYLTLAAVHTHHVRLATCVTDPYTRHPALTAAAMSTVDEIAGGRGILGIGAGSSGMGAMGLKRVKPAAAVREAVEVIRALWRGGSVTATGNLIRFAGAGLDFTSRADIPVYIAGRGPQILELAGEIAEGVIIGALASPPTLDYAMRHIQTGQRRGGRPPGCQEIAIWLHTVLDADGARARDAVRPMVVSVLVSSAPVLDEIGVVLPDALRARIEKIPFGIKSGAMQEAAPLVPDDVLEHFTVAGDGAFCRQRIAALANAGVAHIAVNPKLTHGQTMEQFIETFAAEIISPLRA